MFNIVLIDYAVVISYIILNVATNNIEVEELVWKKLKFKISPSGHFLQ